MKRQFGIAALAVAIVAVVGCSVHVTGATLDATDWTAMNNGTSVPFTQQLVTTVSPANATNQNVTWKSSDESLATVSSTGLVTWMGGGTANLTITFGTQKMLTARYSSGSSGSAPSAFAARSLSCWAQLFGDPRLVKPAPRPPLS